MCPRLISTDHSTTIDTVAVAEDFRIDTKSNTLGITATGLSIDLAGVDVGSIVKVKGGIGEFRGVRQMTLEKISASAIVLSFLPPNRIQLLCADSSPPPKAPSTQPMMKHMPGANCPTSAPRSSIILGWCRMKNREAHSRKQMVRGAERRSVCCESRSGIIKSKRTGKCRA